VLRYCPPARRAGAAMAYADFLEKFAKTLYLFNTLFLYWKCDTDYLFQFNFALFFFMPFPLSVLLLVFACYMLSALGKHYSKKYELN
jgi:hypothetical protein